jgi:transposase
MAGFIEEADRGQLSLLPGSLDDWIGKDNPVRVIDAFVDGLDLKKLGFETVEPLDIGRPGYHPSIHSSSTSMAIFIGCNRAGGWSASAIAIWK